jgi:ABC-type lipoprotein release transport system permease subunit
VGRTSRGASTAPAALSRIGLPTTLTTGVRLALVRGAAPNAAPVAATLFAAVVAVAVATTALTLSASIDHLFATPRLYGQSWDYRFLEIRDGLADRKAAANLRADPRIGQAAVGSDGEEVLIASPDASRSVGLWAMDDVKGHLSPVVVEGRAPRTDRELVLGTKTLHALHVAIGDTVTLRRFDESRTMRIVGRGPIAGVASSDPGDGAAMTFAAFQALDINAPGSCCMTFEVKLATTDSSKRRAELAWLERTHSGPLPALPRTVADFGGVDATPIALAGLLVLAGAAALAHTLVTAIRRRRRDLAILKTLGFDARQVATTVVWQATTFAAVGLLVGIPLGIAAGRWAWTVFANQIGVVPEPVTPLPLILLVVPGAVLLANLVALVPARLAARTRPALVLRAE